MPYETKLFEIRDEGTAFPALAIRVEAEKTDADFLLRRAGYDASLPCVILMDLCTRAAEHDPHAWRGPRTLRLAHRFIEAAWAELASGDAVDVEFILGLREAPKPSERINHTLVAVAIRLREEMRHGQCA
jgi:hypothetical protein